MEALAQWAGPPDVAKGRRDRAHELIEHIAAHQWIEPFELVLQKSVGEN